MIIVDLVTYIDFGISGLSVHLMSTQLSIFLCDCLKDRYFTIILLKSLKQLEEVSIKVILKVHVKYETLQLQNTGMLFVMISKSYIRKRYFFKANEVHQNEQASDFSILPLQVPQGVFDRNGQKTLNLTLKVNQTIDILVENMGHIGFGSEMNNNSKV